MSYIYRSTRRFWQKYTQEEVSQGCEIQSVKVPNKCYDELANTDTQSLISSQSMEKASRRQLQSSECNRQAVTMNQLLLARTDQTLMVVS